ncbi:hypothetical protein [Puniceicoccus vermicola]|uniref:Uncharacterized protein n=1 Tax=Puniceicoccus vermicola TaxID=388746 RepID=A0A7X1E6Y0_9BACT|nr:hypothetical protein [Puniceicoccus vermicola]MBC2603112.1 hypothetical protein [Puniceicoccus vermicola]
MDEEVKELQENLKEKESQQELFEKKVFLIGELHTRRALLANRLGRVKSESMMRHDDVEHEARKEAEELGEEMAGISKSITDFRPKSLDDLKSFQTSTLERFDEMEKKIAVAESKLS